ncbi:hypothetical protein [Candidatus Tisiphia endosymbiont of Sialis lutaria]|uniref:hypothetical protein n=1 Tax=Candidatus Tisiphia endosymbiont of Sialis lutaria TaxID=2029164 RepID=UPI00312CA2FA
MSIKDGLILISYLHNLSDRLNFNKIQAELTSVEPASNYKGYGVERLFKCLLCSLWKT